MLLVCWNILPTKTAEYWTKSRMLTTTDAGEGMRSHGNSRATLVGMKNGATVWQFLKKLNMLLACDPAIVLLGIYPKN